jgi:hypothetical protein
MPSYLVETYVPKALLVDAKAAGLRARAAARELWREGASVRYVRTALLPGDETCFHLFVADTPDAVAEACRRAGFDSPRIVPPLSEQRRASTPSGAARSVHTSTR